jgi:menaquinone-dependent protoporphyrinogen oxidase
MATRVLVTSASKHGSTLDIADVIAGVLNRRGLDVVDAPIDEVSDVAGFDAAVIGSAVYVGKWMGEAVEFAERHAVALSAIPVWLFSSGPLGDPLRPDVDPVTIAELMPRVEAREHRLFPGKLDPAQLGMGEKLIVGMVRAPSGDYRDFGAVERWANEIGDALDGTRTEPLPGTVTG